MKNLMTIAVLTLFVTGLLSFTTNLSETSFPKVTTPQDAPKFVVPDKVKAILDNSCLPCHGTEGNAKAKIKWNYDKTAGMKTHKMVSKLAKIVTKVEKGKMPPSKFESKYPGRKLSVADEKVLTEWANSLAESLAK
ncbi:MAG: heme-binding domain-containing protein [Bacteroidales bacterium]|nr:heme-binding domain-containing protein [Bacteroidales bacterium]